MLIKPNSPFYKNPALWLVVLLPLTAVIVGVTFVIFSITHYDGVVEDDYYKKGKQINQTLERDESASKLGLSARVQLDTDKKLLDLELDAVQDFNFPEMLELKFIHRTVANQDVVIQLSQNKSKEYLGVLSGLSQGLWRVELSTPTWRLTGRISYPEQFQFTLLSIQAK